MTVSELGYTLRKMYDKAENREQVTMIFLFSIKYANEINEIKKNGYSLQDILTIAKLPKSYQTEINKGLKLAKYVVVK